MFATPLFFHAFIMQGQRLPSSQVSREWKFRRWLHLVPWWYTTELFSQPYCWSKTPLAGGRGRGACHYLCLEKHHDFYQAHGRQVMKIKAPSVVIADCWGTGWRKLRGRVAVYLVKKKIALAKETLLTEEDVEMWLQHLSDVSTRRKE